MERKNRKLLVDGDILAFICSTACEKPIKWDDDLWTLHASEKESIAKLADTLSYYEEVCFIGNVVIALSDKDNFRRQVNPEYKSNRKSNRKPLTYNPLKQWMIDNYETVIYKNCEADDVLGILATTDDGYDKVILTKDKDLKTIPSTIYFMQGGGSYEEIDTDTADYNFMKQTLVGDRTDGYSGCPSIGEKTAEKLLLPLKGDLVAMWDTVCKQFEKQNLSDKIALEQARLARILRNGEYNTKTFQPKLWSIQ